MLAHPVRWLLGKLAAVAKGIGRTFVPEDLHECWRETAEEFDRAQIRDHGKP